MNPENPSHYKRRTPEQWQTLVEQCHQSGLSGAKFCREHNIAYASFSKWRHKLSAHPVALEAPQASFIDLNLLSEKYVNEAYHRPWHIVLKLGNGVELCLTQTHATA